MEVFNLYIIDHCKCGKEINYKKNGNDDFIQKVFNKDVLESTLLIQWGYTSYKIPAIIDNLLALLLKEYNLSEDIEFYRSLGVYFNYQFIEGLNRKEHKATYDEFNSIDGELLDLKKFFITLKEDLTKQEGHIPIDLLDSIKFNPIYGKSKSIKNAFVITMLIEFLESGIDEFFDTVVLDKKGFVKYGTDVKEELYVLLNKRLGDIDLKAKFIGVFSNIFQIPVTTKDLSFTKLEEGKDVYEYIDSDSQKSIRAAIKRREKLNQ